MNFKSKSYAIHEHLVARKKIQQIVSHKRDISGQPESQLASKVPRSQFTYLMDELDE